MISFDLETHPIARARAAPKPVCASWCEVRGELRWGKIDRFRAEFERFLVSDETLVNAYIAFDMASLAEYWPDLFEAIWAKYLRGQVQDVLINEKLLETARNGLITPKANLATVAKKHGIPHADKSSTWRTEFAALESVAEDLWPQGAIDYMLADASAPLEIAKAQHGADRYGALKLAGFEATKSFALTLASCWGLHTHPGRSRAMADKLEAFLAEAKVDLVEAGLVRPNGKRNTKAAAARMLKALGEATPRTEKGAVKLDKDTCELAADPLLEQYSHYSQSTTLRARVLDLVEGSGALPLQTAYNSPLETGRTSSRKPSPPLVGLQAQNLPTSLGARECLEPRPDTCFFIVDLPTAELRSLSEINLAWFGASDMADQINAGRDVHTWFGSKIVGISYEEMLSRILEDWIKQARDDAKPCNFGFGGGMGVEGFRRSVWKSVRKMYPTYAEARAVFEARFTLERCAELRSLWLASFREMPHYFDRIGRMTRSSDRIVHPASGRVRGGITYCGACNSHFQELTGNAAAAGLIEASRRCYTVRGSALYGSRILMFTHDEIVGEAPLSVAHDAAIEAGQVMMDEFNVWHPKVPIRKIDPALALVYSKKVKPVFGADGRLVPWVPKEVAA